MSFKEAGRKLLLADKKGAKKFLKSYESEFIPLTSALAKYSGLKADIDVGYDQKNLDLVRFAALTNDVFTFAMRPAKEMTMTVFSEPGKRKDIFGEKLNISVETDRVKHLVNEDGIVHGLPAFVHPSHSEARKIVDTLAPLMLRGRALLRPHRVLILPTPNPIGRQKWEVLEIDHSSPFDHWSGEKVASPDSMVPVRTTDPASTKNEVKLFDIVLPFLSGVGFYDLATILEDEELHLAKARVAMKKVVSEANKGDLTKEQVLNEVLRPELDNLERRFKALSRSKILRQGVAAVGAATLSLVAYSTGGLVAALGSAAGASGLGLYAKDWLSDKDKAEAYADNPHYLLWRLRRLQRD
ncbi:hypothetical protein [Neorhizobium petrolearium]|uniref:hypothetical protein n=1 Tax=Neorhizobium petrolearium TaxID=515361 RepID=UPI003F1357B6